MKKDIEDEVLPNDMSGAQLNDESYEGSAGIVLKKGPWTSTEDDILVDYVKKHGEGNWNAVQKHTGLFRCGKSCRLRWANHLRPILKKGAFAAEEERLIAELHAKMGNKWARMAAHVSILYIISICHTYVVITIVFFKCFLEIIEFCLLLVMSLLLCLSCIVSRNFHLITLFSF